MYVQAIAQRRTNGFAVAALVLGLSAWWIYGLGSILAIIFGHIAVHQINRSNGTQGGKGMAIAGLVLGWIVVAVFGLAILSGAYS